MSVQFVLPAKRSGNKRNGNTRPLPLPFPDLHQCGRLRVGHLLTIFGISAPAFYCRKKAGLLPAADGHDGRPYWNVSTITPYLAGGTQ